MIEERVRAYYTHQQRLPEHILFYRDGVSGIQFRMVKNVELDLIKESCRNAGTHCAAGNHDWCPSITLLVVGKCHHAQFYPKQPTRPKTAGANLYSGLVVDTEVTSPWKADFYLQSHDSFLGTARSAHYIVIANESGYTMDQVQEVVSPDHRDHCQPERLEFLLTSSYRPTRSVSLVLVQPKLFQSALQLNMPTYSAIA